MTCRRAGFGPVSIPWAIDAPSPLTGRVYGALLNHRSAVELLAETVDQPPYKGLPKAPVLYIKPRNTLCGEGDPVVVPEGCPQLEIGGCLGLVIGSEACGVSIGDALKHIGGYIIVNDISIPHASYYRPAIRLKARDGFCPIGPRIVAREFITDPDKVVVRTYVDGELRSEATTEDLVRPVSQLLAQVTEFMTLSPGDVLAVGVAAPAPRARPGETVRVAIEGLGVLENPLVRVARDAHQ